MTDSILVFPPGFRLVDTDGAPMSGAKIKFYDAQTTTPRTVYSDNTLLVPLGTTVYTGSTGLPVASSGSSTAVGVYTGSTDYKIIVTDSDDVVKVTIDNLKGAVDTSTFLTSGSTSTLSIPVTTKTANYTIVSGDRGKLIQGNATGGNFTLTLPSAASVGDGWNFSFRNSGTSGQVMLSSTDSIAFEGASFTLRAFEIGEGCTIRCDGVAFKLENHTRGLMASRGPSVITIVDRVSAAPSATPGARYIVSAGFSTYSTGDIIEANGTSFNTYTPPSNCGWIAYVQSENLFYSYQSTAWVAETATSSRKGTTLLSTQAVMETGTATDTVVLVGHQKYHPGHPKHWVTFNGSGGASVNGSFNNSSTARGGTGSYSTTFTTAFSGTGYSYVGVGRQTGTNANGDAGVFGMFNNTSKSASSVAFLTWDGEADATIDSSEINIICVGDQ